MEAFGPLVDVEWLSGSLDDVHLFDSRSYLDGRSGREEFARGHIAGAVMIDFHADSFADEIAALDPDATYLLYCRSGNRSGQAMNLFADLGFEQVSEIDGGIVNWYETGLPVVVP